MQSEKQEKTSLQFYQNASNSNVPNELPFLENSPTTNKKFSPFLRQLFTSSGPLISTIASGAVAGYSAILLPQLQNDDSEIKISREEASWIASISPLLMVFGCIGGGIAMERYGRKFCQLMGYVPYLIGWILIATSLNLTWILVGRFLTGFCSGWLGSSIFVFIAEVTDPRYRGPLLACASLGISLGIFLVHALGTFLTWPLTSAICASLPALCFIVQMLSPESPSWLLANNRLSEAAVSFAWLRGSDVDASNEFESMIKNHSGPSNRSNYSWEVLKVNIIKPEFYKPLYILLIFTLIMQFSGTNAVTFYSIAIFRQTFGLTMDEYLVMIIVDLVRVGMSVVACIVLRRYGRRTIALLSCIGTTVTLLALSAYVHFASCNVMIQNNSWIPLILLLCYICCISIGLVPLPWCMIGELFPLSIRGLGSSITSSVCFFWFFLVVKTSPALFDFYGAEGAFLVYGLFALIGCGFLAIFLPETRNRTLQDIEDSFKAQPQSEA